MKCSLGISNFLEEISSLSHSIVFLYFFALITEKAFLSLLAILWNSAFKWVYLSFSPLLFASLLFTAFCKASSDSHFTFFISFSWGWSWMNVNECVLSYSVMSNSLQSHGLYPIRLLCPWNSPGKNTGVGCHFLLQGIFLSQGLNQCLLDLLHLQADSLP